MTTLGVLPTVMVCAIPFMWKLRSSLHPLLSLPWNIRMEPSGCILARMAEWRGVFDEDACGDVVLAVLLEEVEGGLLVVV